MPDSSFNFLAFKRWDFVDENLKQLLNEIVLSDKSEGDDQFIDALRQLSQIVKQESKGGDSEKWTQISNVFLKLQTNTKYYCFFLLKYGIFLQTTVQ